MKSPFLTILITFGVSAHAAVWVGFEDGLRQYDSDGAAVHTYETYRRPISLVLDGERGRLWFLDAYNYKLVCLDVATGRELFNVPGAAHPPAIGTSDLGVYMLENKPFEPSLALDAGDGSVWVADFYGHQVARYDAEGRELFRSGAFHEPFAIASLGDCTAWVAGGIRTLSLVDARCEVGRNLTGVNEARALAYDAERDLVWVADYRNNRVFAINGEGRLKRKGAEVELPDGLANDAVRGTLWVATTYSGIVRISAETGTVTMTIPEPESVAALDVDDEGRLWVAYDEEELVICYAPGGEELLTIKRVSGIIGLAAE